MSGILGAYGKTNEKENATLSICDSNVQNVSENVNLESSLVPSKVKNVNKQIVPYASGTVDILPSDSLQKNTCSVNSAKCDNTQIQGFDNMMGSFFQQANFGDNASISINVYTNTSK